PTAAHSTRGCPPFRSGIFWRIREARNGGIGDICRLADAGDELGDWISHPQLYSNNCDRDLLLLASWLELPRAERAVGDARLGTSRKTDMSGPAARIQAQAKLNLYLRILTREASGYHSIETIFHRVELADEVVLRVEEDELRTIDVQGAE